jgi:dihydrofolate synthase/folylpolyglutamate synthase
MDHMEILGDTLEKIAAEKAGVIKTNTTVVIGESQDETLPVFSGFCYQKDAPMIIADRIYSVDYSMMSTDECQVFNVKRQGEMYFPNLKCGLLGHYQRRNIVTVLASVEQLSALKINNDALYKGIRNVVVNTGLSGRWQIIKHNPKIICDTAHNAEGMRMVLQQVTETPCRNLHMVIGFVNDKNTDAIMKYMPEQAVYYFVRLSVPRTMDEKELASKAKGYGLRGIAYKNMEDAWNAVETAAGMDDLVVITGSNFLVADFLNMASLRGQFP